MANDSRIFELRAVKRTKSDVSFASKDLGYLSSNFEEWEFWRMVLNEHIHVYLPEVLSWVLAIFHRHRRQNFACTKMNKEMKIKVCIHKRTSPCDWSLQLVPWRLNLHEGTAHRDLSHKQFTRSVLRNKSHGLIPKFQTGLNWWD